MEIEGSRRNFFDDFLNLSSRNDLSDLQRLLLDNLGKYLQSGSWARNEKEKVAFNKIRRGYKAIDIASILEMNINAYRTSICRTGKYLRELLFDGNTLVEALYSNDEIIESYIERIKFLSMHFDMNREFSADIINKIENYVENASDENVTEEDIFLALLFLSKFSAKVVEANLKKLNPAALKEALERLDSNKYEKEMGYFKTMQEIISRNMKVSKELIDRVKSVSEGR